MNIDQTLAERGSRYGEFPEHASITQGIKDAMSTGKNWDALDDDMKECLEMVAHKIGRILNGDPTYIDSWTDIIGYTRLVEKRLIDEQQTAKIFTFPMSGAAEQQAASARNDHQTDATVPKKECDCLICELERSFGKQARA